MFKKLLNFIKINPVKVSCLLLFINNFFWIYRRIRLAPFNSDEFQHTHIAWNQSQDLLIYRDFFEHHGPFYAFINNFIFSWFANPASFDTLTLLRSLSFLCLILMSAMIFIITKELFKDNPTLPYLAILVFSSWIPVQGHGIQIRPDTIQSLFGLIAFYLLLKAIEYKKKDTVYQFRISIRHNVNVQFQNPYFNICNLFSSISTFYTKKKPII